MNPVHYCPPYFPKIHANIIFHLCLGLPNGLFPPGIPTKILYAFLISPMHATCLQVLVLVVLSSGF